TQLISGYLILVKANTLCMVVEQSGKKLAKLEFQASSILLSQRSLQTIQTFIEKLEPTTNQQSSLPLTRCENLTKNRMIEELSVASTNNKNTTSSSKDQSPFEVSISLEFTQKTLVNTEKLSSICSLFIAALFRLSPASFSIREISIKTTRNNENLLQPYPLTNSGIFSQVELSQMHPALARAIIFINKNFQSDITMKQLAAECYVSASHLSSLFKQQFELSFKKILIHLRIEKAKSILNDNPHRQITHICCDAGFTDLSHFEKTFKRYVGMTPGRFRKIAKENLIPLQSSTQKTKRLLGKGKN
ncbi:MAG: AraC family transcriptional regulator, partial [Kangiellaceae bacterium]|nr:AraC family transcriptional regulator [Kangiellaceae bacterium]